MLRPLAVSWPSLASLYLCFVVLLRLGSRSLLSKVCLGKTNQALFLHRFISRNTYFTTVVWSHLAFDMYRGMCLQLRHQEVHQRRLDERNTGSKKSNLDGNGESRGLCDLLERGWLLFRSHDNGSLLQLGKNLPRKSASAHRNMRSRAATTLLWLSSPHPRFNLGRAVIVWLVVVWSVVNRPAEMAWLVFRWETSRLHPHMPFPLVWHRMAQYRHFLRIKDS